MKQFDWLFNTPIAHRGIHNDKYPENSMPAYKAAIDKKKNIEIDVHLTSDGEVVVFHDADLERMCGEKIKISDIPSQSLSNYKLKGTEYTIPLLVDLFELIQGQVGLLIEIKHLFGSCDELCSKLYELIKGYKGNVAIQSFAPKVVKWFKNNAPEIPRGLLATSYNEMKVANFVKKGLNIMTKLLGNTVLKKIKPDFIAYNINSFPSDRLRKLREEGMPFLTWTVKNPEQLEFAKDWADNVIFESFLVNEFSPSSKIIS